MNRILPLAFAATALLCSVKSFASNSASECNTYAAGYEQDVHGYFQLDTGRGLSGQSEQLVKALAGLLDGKWRGNSSAINCVGHYSRSDAETTHYSVEAEVSRKLNGALKLEAEQSNRRSVKLTRLYLTPELDRVTVANSRNYSIEFLSPTRVRFDHKYRARNGVTEEDVPRFSPDPRSPEEALRFPERAYCLDANPSQREVTCNSTRLIHEIKEIDLNDDQLTVDHRLFMNGLFVSHEKWMLKRS